MQSRHSPDSTVFIPGKEDTMVLDFINEADQIQKAFRAIL